MSAVGSGNGEVEVVQVRDRLAIVGECSPVCRPQYANELRAYPCRGERDRERAARSPKPGALHAVPPAGAASWAASAAGDNCSSASRTDVKTPRIRWKRLIAMISRTTGD